MNCRGIKTNLVNLLLVIVVGLFIYSEAASLECGQDVPDHDRIDCGYPGMNSSDCENRRGCCWKPAQDVTLAGVPYCFFNANVTSEIKTEQTCEHQDPIQLSCNSDEVIDVFNVFYGYHDDSTCHVNCNQNINITSCDPCYNPNGIKIVEGLCQCKSSCTVPAKGQLWDTGSYCVFFNNDAKIQYRCIPKDPTSCPLVVSLSMASTASILATSDVKVPIAVPTVTLSRSTSPIINATPSQSTMSGSSILLEATRTLVVPPVVDISTTQAKESTASTSSVLPTYSRDFTTSLPVSNIPTLSTSSIETDLTVIITPGVIPPQTSIRAEAVSTSSQIVLLPSAMPSVSSIVLPPPGVVSTTPIDNSYISSSQSPSSITAQYTTMVVFPPIASADVTSQMLDYSSISAMHSMTHSVASSEQPALPKTSAMQSLTSSAVSTAVPVLPEESFIVSSSVSNYIQSTVTSVVPPMMSSALPEVTAGLQATSTLSLSEYSTMMVVESSMSVVSSTINLPPVIPPAMTSSYSISQMLHSSSSTALSMATTISFAYVTSSAVLPIIPPVESTSTKPEMTAEATSIMTSMHATSSSVHSHMSSSEATIPIRPTSSTSLPEVAETSKVVMANSSSSSAIKPSTTVVPTMPSSSTSALAVTSSVKSSSTPTPPLPSSSTTSSESSSVNEGVPTSTVSPSSSFTVVPSSSIAGGGGTGSAIGEKEKLKPITITLIIISLLIVMVLIALAVYFYRKRNKSRNFLCYKGSPLYNISYRYLETYFPESGKYVPMEASAIPMGSVTNTTKPKEGYSNGAIDKEI